MAPTHVSLFSNLVLSILLLFSVSASAYPLSDPTHVSFLSCISSDVQPSGFSQLLYAANTSSYSSLLLSTAQNLRFTSSTTPKPLFIISPVNELQVQTTVMCCRNHGLLIRVRSGGHDYEGLSYRSVERSTFVLLDMANLRSVDVDAKLGTAWVQSGAILGEVYYKIAKASNNTYGFPAGICPTVGVGGHFGGGGFGTIVRKHGLAVDHVIDAKLIDVNGRLLDRESMGEDLFWAIRGGGGLSFGIIVSWKVTLVPVPPTVTLFSIQKSLQQGALELLHRWQYIAPKLREDLFLEAVISAPMNGTKGAQASFNAMFLGRCGELLKAMGKEFPQLGANASDCKEMSWIESVMHYVNYYYPQPEYKDGQPLENLMDRKIQPKVYNKIKSDFVKEPIALNGWKGIWNMFLEEGAGSMFMDPFGGRMDEIPESATPFPHRKGNLYNIQYLNMWNDGGAKTSEVHLGWSRRLYKHMAPYVSKNPRAAYVNFRDLDLGMNKENGTISLYVEAKGWGRKYFKGNFKRLAMVKGRVDPENYFKYEQSIPPLIAYI